jgi:glycosyltransferase involved in cell wall biosynthesis
LAETASLEFGSVVIFPVVEPGRGGFGQHVMQVRDHLQSRGTTVELGPHWEERPARVTVDPWRWLGSSPATAQDQYDRWCAKTHVYGPETDAVIAFPGSALHTFRAAPPHVRKVLVSTTFHAPTHRSWAMRAIRRAPLERSWLTPRLVAKMERETALADVVISNSSLTTRTFVEAGHRSDKFVLVPLTARDIDWSQDQDAAVDIVYLGALTVEKGVVDLLRAFSQLRDRSVRLRLMGGPRSPGMKAYLKRAVARDDRVRVSPGDPARQLGTARLLVHPSYADSFAYSVAEGIAAGIPVITTDRVGASDLIGDGRAHPSSRVLPAGDGAALLDSITEILGTS